MTGHVVLLGDSIFDNAAYTAGEPDVVTHLRGMLPPDWRASLGAIDGSTTGNLAAQVRSVPSDATHLVISVGGNDAIMNSDVLNLPVLSTAEALSIFGERARQFENAYTAAIGTALALGRPITVCTIYNGNLSQAEAPLARVALVLFNDVILRVAFARCLTVIELRLICDEPADYANPIEPSGRGGQKIAAAIAGVLGCADNGSKFSRVHAR